MREASLPDLLQEVDDSDKWSDASLVECLHYAAASKFLKVPVEFRGLIEDYLGGL